MWALTARDYTSRMTRHQDTQHSFRADNGTTYYFVTTAYDSSDVETDAFDEAEFVLATITLPR